MLLENYKLQTDFYVDIEYCTDLDNDAVIEKVYANDDSPFKEGADITDLIDSYTRHELEVACEEHYKEKKKEWEGDMAILNYEFERGC